MIRTEAAPAPPTHMSQRNESIAYSNHIRVRNTCSSFRRMLINLCDTWRLSFYEGRKLYRTSHIQEGNPDNSEYRSHQQLNDTRIVKGVAIEE